MNVLPSIQRLAADVSAGRCDPRQPVRCSLDRIARDDARLQAWVEVYDDAALEAAGRLAERQARGDQLGCLAGVPVGIKDIFDIQGRPTRAASPLRDAHVAGQDAEVVARLRAADAIIVGKTVTTELACFDPPPTSNPWDFARTPGGSSSGSAAALAAGMCCGALGSQTGGSITRPAAYCGVAGLKPAYGRLPLDGVLPVSHHLDHPGPMARSAGDLAALWRALAGELSPAPRSAPRIALLGDDYWRLDEGAEAYRQAAAGLGELPVVVLEADLESLRRRHWTIMAVEAAAVHREQFRQSPQSFGDKVSELIQAGLETPAWQFADSLDAQRRFRQHVARQLAPWDAVVTPAAAGPAPSRDTTGDPRMNSIWSLAGAATVALPCQWIDGLPVALQLASVRGEGPLLSTAGWCEQRLEFTLPDYPSRPR